MSAMMDQTSQAIGVLQGEIEALKQAIRDSNTSRRDLYRQTSEIVAQMAEISTRMGTMADTVAGIVATVREHEDVRQQGLGVRGTLQVIVTALGASGAIEAIRHLLR